MVNGFGPNARAGVDDIKLHPAAFAGKVNDDLAALIGEFHGVIHQIVYHLENGVMVRRDLQLVGDVQVHIDLMVAQLPFKAQHDAPHQAVLERARSPDSSLETSTMELARRERRLISSETMFK